MAENCIEIVQFKQFLLCNSKRTNLEGKRKHMLKALENKEGEGTSQILDNSTLSS